MPVDVFNRHGRVVHQDAHRQRETAERHQIDGFPEGAQMATELNTDNGMESAMISVLRQEPRNSRIISAVSAAAMMPSRITPLTAARTKSDWSANSFTCKSEVTPP